MKTKINIYLSGAKDHKNKKLFAILRANADRLRTRYEFAFHVYKKDKCDSMKKKNVECLPVLKDLAQDKVIYGMADIAEWVSSINYQVPAEIDPVFETHPENEFTLARKKRERDMRSDNNVLRPDKKETSERSLLREDQEYAHKVGIHNSITPSKKAEYALQKELDVEIRKGHQKKA